MARKPCPRRVGPQNVKNVLQLRRRTKDVSARKLLLEAVWKARRLAKQLRTREEISEFLKAPVKKGELEAQESACHAVSGGGGPRPAGEAKKLIGDFFGGLFSDQVRDSDLFLTPSVWLPGSEAKDRWTEMQAWDGSLERMDRLPDGISSQLRPSDVVFFQSGVPAVAPHLCDEALLSFAHGKVVGEDSISMEMLAALPDEVRAEIAD
eukprot:11098398-Alexandrium_andersonii.AAC.1